MKWYKWSREERTIFSNSCHGNFSISNEVWPSTTSRTPRPPLWMSRVKTFNCRDVIAPCVYGGEECGTDGCHTWVNPRENPARIDLSQLTSQANDLLTSINFEVFSVFRSSSTSASSSESLPCSSALDWKEWLYYGHSLKTNHRRCQITDLRVPSSTSISHIVPFIFPLSLQCSFTNSSC